MLIFLSTIFHSDQIRMVIGHEPITLVFIYILEVLSDGVTVQPAIVVGNFKTAVFFFLRKPRRSDVSMFSASLEIWNVDVFQFLPILKGYCDWRNSALSDRGFAKVYV